MYKIFRNLSFLLLVLCTSALGGDTVPRTESEVKAAFLFTFLKYLEHSGNKTEPIIITVVGKDPFSGALKKYAGRQVKGREVKLVYLDHNIKDIEKGSKSHLLYIDDSAILLQKKVLKLYEPYKPLTIADNEWFLESGGMINFVTMSRKIRWEVNHQVIKKNDIAISSKVLRLAVNKENK
ncbi:YfiR family protein [Lentisphaera profundi]|uniref:YfiR family protein n=1 Tax=Lentisphaera profundi TaxID=1658616 RepID=A0ABY7VQU9_9BACT|nr:YfiR family protein [Lentisphaera profundi]WDE95620.1 YfiR family protein [Lentisphaera profundi]